MFLAVEQNWLMRTVEKLQEVRKVLVTFITNDAGVSTAPRKFIISKPENKQTNKQKTHLVDMTVDLSHFPFWSKRLVHCCSLKLHYFKTNAFVLCIFESSVGSVWEILLKKFKMGLFSLIYISQKTWLTFILPFSSSEPLKAPPPYCHLAIWEANL